MRGIYITEVSPRDGLQNVKQSIPTDVKVKMVNMLSESGVDEIEVSSFVSPKWVPQLADAEEVFRRIKRHRNVVYSALVPNQKGLDRALSVEVDKIAVFTSASETFNLKNINMSISESILNFKEVVRRAKENKLAVRGYISTAFHCPYEGKISPMKVVDVANKLMDIGVDEISIGDTIGKASPKDVQELLEVLLKYVSPDRIVMHFHATYGMAIANVYVSYKEFGIYRFDASAGGLGGCPFAPGARGNVATEDVVYLLKSIGADVKVDISKVVQAVRITGLELSSHLSLVV